MYKLFISKALRYGPYVTVGSHSFTCHPHTNHTWLYSPAIAILAIGNAYRGIHSLLPKLRHTKTLYSLRSRGQNYQLPQSTGAKC